MTGLGVYPGTLFSGTEQDYYVFYARKGTVLSVTLSDAENPACLACDGLTASLDNSSARTVAYTPTSATVINGIPVPGLFSVTLRRAGTYYLIVSGVLTRDSNGDPIPCPTTLSSTGPRVQWPPPCTVPALRRPTSLASAAPVAIVVSSGRGHKRPASRRRARRHHHRRGHKR